MKYFLILFFCSISTISYSQDSVNYRFIVKDPVIFDTVSNAYMDMNLEFSYQRVYLERNIFREKGLFTRSEKGITTTVFKKNGNTWHLKNKSGRWVLFYSDSCKRMPTPEIMIAGKKYQIKWVEKTKLNDSEVSIFVLNPVGFTINHQPKYVFDAAKGVIALNIDETILIRSDLLKRQQ